MRKQFRVEITARAERDILDTRDFITQDKPAAAIKWVREIKRQIRSLKTMPLRHEIIPEAQDLGVEYRHLIFGSYRTIYRVQDDRVIVLRVIHGARLLEQSLFRE